MCAQEQRVGYFSKKPSSDNLMSPAVSQQKPFWLKKIRRVYHILTWVTSLLKNIILLQIQKCSKSVKMRLANFLYLIILGNARKSVEFSTQILYMA
jgi:hypothetical protein